MGYCGVALLNIYEFFFQLLLCNDELVAPTMTAHCNNLRWDTKSSLSKQDIISMSTFPQDFDFMTENLDSISYVCRMSVPPIMIKRVAERLKPILLREKKRLKIQKEEMC